ncbi:hypothetical protein [Limnofasciculus baicalensis]|uniref:Uncharacterized protein n=1 Tax=Limnofasciculus baicalensis BBK-W-15 TaxID=2699891 RepID=A0AAE3KQJ9_9CYAN|nr:hypothetical protein [Limnofasciculus baicalensis]MCP2732539.1 hypothetical protein [Limnofasciculus baicalensis BBK-W-15]
MNFQKLPLKFHLILAGIITVTSTISTQSKVEAFSIVAEIPNSVTGQSVNSILATDGRFQNVGIASLNPSPTLSVDNAVAFSISNNKTPLPISDSPLAL